MERLELAEKIAEMTDGKVWVKGDHVRVYHKNRGFAIITADCRVDTDYAKSTKYGETCHACESLGVEYGRAL